MSQTAVKNVSNNPISLPTPFSGLLRPGELFVIAAAASDVVSWLGGADVVRGVLDVAAVSSIQAPGAQASLAAGIQKRTVTVAAADLQALAGGVQSKAFNMGAVLPSNAKIVGGTIEALTLFDDATHGTWQVKVGEAVGANSLCIDKNIAAGSGTTAPLPFQSGMFQNGCLPAMPISGQVAATIHASVDLNTATAGSITVSVYFYVMP